MDTVIRVLELEAERVKPDCVALTLEGMDSSLDTRGLLKDSVFATAEQSVIVSWTGARSFVRLGGMCGRVGHLAHM